MRKRRTFAALLFIVPAMVVGCQQKTTPAAKQTNSQSKYVIGKQLMALGFQTRSIWGGGYTVRVFPDEYLVLEDRNCTDAKQTIGGRSASSDLGLCTIRLDHAHSERFESAMRPYRRYAAPLSSYSPDQPVRRPDGKPCRVHLTDSTYVDLIWITTEGAEMAIFYRGCDPKEFGAFYKALDHVTDALPIHGFIAED